MLAGRIEELGVAAHLELSSLRHMLTLVPKKRMSAWLQEQVCQHG
jgi:hypothetical protein